jgi:hypothetical protein
MRPRSTWRVGYAYWHSTSSRRYIVLAANGEALIAGEVVRGKLQGVSRSIRVMQDPDWKERELTKVEKLLIVRWLIDNATKGATP